MTSKKPDRSVSKMNVLNDIRWLLSTSQETGISKQAQGQDKAASQAASAAVDEEVKRYKALVEKQIDEIDKLKGENKALIQKQQDETGKPKTDNKAQVQKLQDEIDKLKSENKTLVQKQQELDKLRSENKELLAKLDALASTKAKPATPGAGKMDMEIAQMEATKDQMSIALSQIEGLLQLKSKDLMGRLARVYQEAAQGEIALEFRKGRDELESLENLAHFVQALLGE